ncbi:hypothetical protein ELI17_37355 [Rhizobium ruizarguesonis]|uniref:hypothetical protein n=1 Tax=Rhizobium ruizarguesonis TaxID=2081791 RepID=UPI00102F7D0A|nr:hypothetical protein [Rhizobium ruizarguesonis]TAW39041.1 hypothetical protein ELI17_37355 [Rhizobium ruizarguesonis]
MCRFNEIIAEILCSLFVRLSMGSVKFFRTARGATTKSRPSARKSIDKQPIVAKYAIDLWFMEGVMGVPDRFAVEYPRRALELIEMLETSAREKSLLGSFGLLAASAVLTIPFERMRTGHFLHDNERDADLVKHLKALEKAAFLKAPFWRKAPEDGEWRQSRIMGNVDKAHRWLDQDGRDPRSEEANTIQTRKASQVLRVLRNALAHGNIIYLDRDGEEIAGNQMVYMAFLSRYEETAEQCEQAETYRLVIATEDAFLHFVKSWAGWIADLDLDRRVDSAA